MTLAQDRDIAVVVVDHLRKTRETESIAHVTMERVRGSSAKIQYARSLIVLEEPNPEDETIRVRVEKANFCRPPRPVGMLMNADGTAEWCEAPQTAARPTKQQQARDLLTEMLANGPVASTAVVERGKLAGISESSIDRARKELGVIATKVGDGWMSSLPGREGEES